MQRMATIVSVCLMLCAVTAAAQMQPMVPGPEMEKIKFMQGTWKAHITIDASEWGPGGTSVGTSTFTLLSGVWMHHIFEGEMPGMGVFHGVGMMAWDAAKGDYVSYWFDNYGAYTAEYRGTLDGNKLLFTRESDWQGQKMWEKHYYILGDDKAFDFIMEMSMDGITYTQGMKIHYTR